MSHMATNIDKEVGRQFHSLLWERRRTQKDAAALLGIEQSTLAHKLRGNRKWTLTEVVTLADYLGVSITDILPPSSSPSAALRAHPDGERYQSNVEQSRAEREARRESIVLPRLDSNQQPVDYPLATVTQIRAKRTATADIPDQRNQSDAA